MRGHELLPLRAYWLNAVMRLAGSHHCIRKHDFCDGVGFKLAAFAGDVNDE